MNLGALKSAVAAYANRSDLTAMMPTFLELAEDRIYSGDPVNAVEPLRLSLMIQTGTYTPAAGVVTVPAMLEVIRVRDAATRTVFRPMEADKIGAIEGYSSARSYAFDVRGGKIVLAPLGASPVEVVSYTRPTTPTADADENGVMQAYPGIYLHAMLIEAGLYLADDDMTIRALKAWQSAMAGAQAADARAEAGGASALTIRADTWGKP